MSFFPNELSARQGGGGGGGGGTVFMIESLPIFFPSSIIIFLSHYSIPSSIQTFLRKTGNKCGYHKLVTPVFYNFLAARKIKARLFANPCKSRHPLQNVVYNIWTLYQYGEKKVPITGKIICCFAFVNSAVQQERMIIKVKCCDAHNQGFYRAKR